MRQSLKVAISLLASLLLFAGFAVLAFSGLFTVLQASFFLPRIEQGYTAELQTVGETIDSFHKANFVRFSAVAQKDFIARTFAVTLANDTVTAWADMTRQLGIEGVRLIGADGRRILYSSFLDIDVKQPGATSIAFNNYNEDNTAIPADTLVTASQRQQVLIDGAREVLVYPVAVAGQGASAGGTLVFYVSAKDLFAQLVLSHGLLVDHIALVGTSGLLINGPAVSPAVEGALATLWSRNPGSASFTDSLVLTGTDGVSSGYRVFAVRLANGGVAGTIYPNGRFEMSDLMKGLLLATFFLTVFLLVYLLLNLRSDPLEVLRQRVKRFQIQLISELVESPGGVDWGKWRREIESRREEITWQIQRGIGRVSRRQKPVIDDYMTKSWGEIIDLISRRSEAPAAPAVGAMDITRLEALIRSALQNASFVLPAATAAPVRAFKVEEISAADVTEAPADRAPVAQAAEAEELETLEEAAPVEVAAAESAAPAKAAAAVEEAEAVEELEEAEEVEEIEEAEAVEEAEPVEAAELVEAAQVEAFHDAEAVEELEEAEPAGEAAEEAQSGEFIEAAEVLDPAEEVEAAQSVEEEGALEPVAELEEIEAETPAASSSLVDTMREIAEGVEAPAEAELLEEAGTPAEHAFPDTSDLESEDSGIAELELLGDEVAIPARAAGLLAHGAAETGSVPRIPQGTITDFVQIRIPRGSQATKEATSELLPSVEVIDAPTELLEELQPVQEILPLAPEPVEEGLELLPAAEEAGRIRPRETDMTMSGEPDLPEVLPPDEEVAEERPGTGRSAGAVSTGAPAPLPSLAPAATDESLDFEELEAADEEELPAAASTEGESDEEAELASLVASGGVTSWTIDELRGMVDDADGAIVMENGVFRIKQEVYTAPEKSKQGRAEQDLREIVAEVMQNETAEPSTPPAASDDQHTGGIGDLLRDEDTLDLSKVISADKLPEAEEVFSPDREKSVPLRLKRNGIDYDEFLATYPRSFTHTTQMKSLVEVSRRVSAVSAGVFLKKLQQYAMDLTVGLSDKSIPLLHFDSPDAFFSSFLSSRKAVAINKNPAEVRFLKKLFEEDDLRYMRHMLFLPAIFRGQEAYLCLSFSSETEIAPGVLLSKLLVQ